jgi:hypothetical protein
MLIGLSAVGAVTIIVRVSPAAKSKELSLNRTSGRSGRRDRDPAKTVPAQCALTDAGAEIEVFQLPTIEHAAVLAFPDADRRRPWRSTGASVGPSRQNRNR